MSMRSRNKGKRGERDAAKTIERVFGISARRGQQFAGGPESPDVVADALHGIHIEVKRSETFAPYAALAQAQKDGFPDAPLVLYRRNRKDWIAVCYLDQLPRITTALYLSMAGRAGAQNMGE